MTTRKLPPIHPGTSRMRLRRIRKASWGSEIVEELKPDPQDAGQPSMEAPA